MLQSGSFAGAVSGRDESRSLGSVRETDELSCPATDSLQYLEGLVTAKCRSLCRSPLARECGMTMYEEFECPLLVMRVWREWGRKLGATAARKGEGWREDIGQTRHGEWKRMLEAMQEAVINSKEFRRRPRGEKNDLE